MTRLKQRARRWVFRELDRLSAQQQSAEPKELSANPTNRAKSALVVKSARRSARVTILRL
jgi:hypothetical protein